MYINVCFVVYYLEWRWHKINLEILWRRLFWTPRSITIVWFSSWLYVVKKIKYSIMIMIIFDACYNWKWVTCQNASITFYFLFLIIFSFLHCGESNLEYILISNWAPHSFSPFGLTSRYFLYFIFHSIFYRSSCDKGQYWDFEKPCAKLKLALS